MDREEKGYLTIDEMAEYLNLNPAQIKNLLKVRKLEMFAATLVNKVERTFTRARGRQKKKKR